MFNNYLKVALRNLMRNKVFVLINVFGLGIALLCCIIAFLNWDYNAKFDSSHVNADNVYRINFIRITNGEPIKNGSCPLPLGDQVSSSVSQVDQVIRYYPIGGNFRVDNEVFRTEVTAVDPEFFDVFTFPMVTGSPFRLGDKQSIVISSLLREKHFPDNPNPVGETIHYINGDKKEEFQVAGVFEKPPLNSSFQSEAYIPYSLIFEHMDWERDDWTQFNTSFVTVENPGDVPEVERQLQAWVEVQNRAKEDYKVSEYYLDPFVGMAVRSERDDIWNHWLSQSLPTAAALAPAIMALLILLIACFNFTNTSIAIANQRIKEIAIRKVLGSNRRQLIYQFMGENILMVLLSLAVGLLLAVFLVPAYSAMWPFLDIQLNLLENTDLLAFLLVLSLFTALLAGSYPALYISNFEPTAILRGKVKFSGTNALTRILLTLQYAISLLAIISGFVFNANAEYQANYDMGFDMESILSAYVSDEAGYTNMRNELQGYEQILGIAGSRHSVSSSWYTDPIKFESSELDVDIFDVGSGYLSTIGATIIEGRDFLENSQIDAQSSVIINEELVKTMAWEEPIGKRIILKDTVALNVIAVVKDIYYKGGLWDPLKPMLLRYAEPSRFRYISVRAKARDLVEVKELMDATWQRVFPDKLSTVRFMDEELAETALVNDNIKTMFIFLGLTAVFLSVIGLFSLVSLNITKRLKEIGIRKVLGASIRHISMKVSREFVIILAIASVVGCVGAYYMTELLMGSIWAYHVPLQLPPFIISVVLLFIVSGIAIGGKVYKVATLNPADILRDD